jgi:hypothetical protein
MTQTQVNGQVSEQQSSLNRLMTSQKLVYYSPSLSNSLQKDRTTMEE